MDCRYKGVGGQEAGEMGGEGGCAAIGGLHFPIGLFAASMSPGGASHRPTQA